MKDPTISEIATEVIKTIGNIVSDEVKKAFKPEFLNRIDEFVVFVPFVALGEVVGSSAQAMLAAQTQYITATDKRIALTPIALEGPSSRPCDYSEAVERSLQGS